MSGRDHEITKEEFVRGLLIFAAAAAFLVLVSIFVPGCAGPGSPPSPTPAVSPTVPPNVPVPTACCALAWGLRDGVVHRGVVGTGYFPDSSALEGGFNNRYGEPLATLQGYLKGSYDHVSIALDKGLGKVKRRVCSPQLSAAFGRPLKLIVEDTGGAFTGKGWTRADICTASYKDSLDSVINGKFDLIECE